MDTNRLDEEAEAPAIQSPLDELPSNIDLDRTSISEAATQLVGILQYAKSLPERTFRSASALAGGIVRESANWLVPSSFQNARSYSVFAQKMLETAANDLAGVRRSLWGEKGQSKKEHVDVARKTVGNLLDVTALSTFHISPLTVAAVYSDIAFDTQDAIRSLGERLEEHGIIPTGSCINSTTELVGAVAIATGDASEIFGSPPLSIDCLHRTISDIRDYTGNAAESPNTIRPDEIVQLLRQMELAAQQENASIWDISATVSLVAMHEIHTRAGGDIVDMKLSNNLFDEEIFIRYWSGLRTIERVGLIAALSSAAEPYLNSIWNNYSINRRTWTDQLRKAELVKWGWSRLSWPKQKVPNLAVRREKASRPDGLQ